MKFIKGLLLSLASLTGGFIAMTVPFLLFRNLTAEALHIAFFIELAVYFVVGIIFLVIYENKRQRKIKAQKRQELRCEKVRRVQREWVNLAA